MLAIAKSWSPSRFPAGPIVVSPRRMGHSQNYDLVGQDLVYDEIRKPMQQKPPDFANGLKRFQFRISEWVLLDLAEPSFVLRDEVVSQAGSTLVIPCGGGDDFLL